METVASIPPDGAGLLNNMVPVALLPPATLGVMVTLQNRRRIGIGRDVNEDGLRYAARCGGDVTPVGNVETGLVLIAKLTALFPCGILTEAGT